ncbi:unnamed protein product [Allacma fusca]|uniref:Uncharacterized protein n=1 Tax=Allacma fusca TaxID=39272 RepID=A0A8J2M5T6_9HEXA|nr:unnamed protein product [Allacma fusca]
MEKCGTETMLQERSLVTKETTGLAEEVPAGGSTSEEEGLLKTDPWSNAQELNALDNLATPKSEVEHSENEGLNFDDNFQPFVKLPDSPEYLASLESKLKKVQRGSKPSDGVSSKDILESLTDSHKSCMVRLLTDSINNLNNPCFGDGGDIRVNPVLKKIAPEKQAIGVEELVHLVKADQLELLFDVDETQEKP